MKEILLTSFILPMIIAIFGKLITNHILNKDIYKKILTLIVTSISFVALFFLKEKVYYFAGITYPIVTIGMISSFTFILISIFIIFNLFRLLVEKIEYDYYYNLFIYLFILLATNIVPFRMIILFMILDKYLPKLSNITNYFQKVFFAILLGIIFINYNSGINSLIINTNNFELINILSMTSMISILLVINIHLSFLRKISLKHYSFVLLALLAIYETFWSKNSFDHMNLLTKNVDLLISIICLYNIALFRNKNFNNHLSMFIMLFYMSLFYKIYSLEILMIYSIYKVLEAIFEKFQNKIDLLLEISDLRWLQSVLILISYSFFLKSYIISLNIIPSILSFIVLILLISKIFILNRKKYVE